MSSHLSLLVKKKTPNSYNEKKSEAEEGKAAGHMGRKIGVVIILQMSLFLG